MSVPDGQPDNSERCNCGPGVWGTCDDCDIEKWVWHSCPGGCDDVTCVDGTTCRACATGVMCPVHDGDSYEEDGWEDAS